MPVWKIRLSLPAKWRGIQKLVYIFLDYEPELACLQTFLSLGKVFVDVGAYLGIYSVVASKLLGDTGLVLAFEPSADIFKSLIRNARLNEAQNVLVFPVALSHQAGSATLFHHYDPCRNSLEDTAEPDGEETVLVETLDERLEKEGVARVDMIKIDVEGAEEMVLRGASRTLYRFRPVVLFEMLDPNRNGAWLFLREHGYELFKWAEGASAPLPIQSPNSGGNFLAIPREGAGPKFLTQGPMRSARSGVW